MGCGAVCDSVRIRLLYFSNYNGCKNIWEIVFGSTYSVLNWCVLDLVGCEGKDIIRFKLNVRNMISFDAHIATNGVLYFQTLDCSISKFPIVLI